MAPAGTDRLRDGRDIAAVLRGRRKRAGTLLVVHVAERSDSAPTRVAVVASRRVGGAVERNRAKRLLRAAAAALAWSPGNDVVLVARAACAEADMGQVRAELRSAGEVLGVLGVEEAEDTSRVPVGSDGAL